MLGAQASFLVFKVGGFLVAGLFVLPRPITFWSTLKK